jgi:GNAT superfamily N-acetyltransferase
MFDILAWDKTPETTVEIFNLVKLINPHFIHVDQEDAVHLMRSKLDGFEDSLSIAWSADRVVGFMFLSRGRKSQIAEIHGGVHPDLLRQGIGQALFTQTFAQLENHPQVKSVSAFTFKSTPGGSIALKKWGFSLMDQVHSSAYQLSSSPPQWSIDKYERFTQSHLRVVTGEELKALRSDWDQAWWRLDMSTVDIPSKIEFEPISFELWSAAAQPPLCQLDHTLFVLDDLDPIASLRLGPLHQGAMNINFTNVVSAYRRQGISTAIKLGAFKLAKALGAQEVTTQNHQANPILKINQRLGFTEIEVIYEYLRAR